MTISYGQDLAYIHDAGFGLVAKNAIPVIVDTLQKQGFARGLVVELGCGSGITAKGLTEEGYDVLGIDQSFWF
jgi:methylase of polypeptide subunit release factors